MNVHNLYTQLYISAIKTPLLLDTTLLIKFVRLAAGQWFSWYTPPIKQDSHDITEILYHNDLLNLDL
jgi:hypothetical protein